MTNTDNSCGISCISWTPKWLQSLKNKKVMIILLSIVFIFQQCLANGFPLVILRHLEIRYNLNSQQIGIISTMYEISDTAISIFLIHLLRNVRKPRSIMIGAMIAAIGGIIFILPHWLSSSYEVDLSSDCPVLDTSSCSIFKATNNKFYGIFVFAMTLIGCGSIPLHSLVPIYIDDNVEQKNVPLYQSIFLALGILGPAIGFGLGGVFANMHVDFNREIKTPVELTSDDPIWVGAWWLGMLIAAICLFASCLFVGLLPTSISHKGDERQVVQENKDREDKDNALISFVSSLKEILSNKVFMFISIGGAADAWLLQSLASFILRYVTLMYNVSLSTASYAGGLILIIGGILGYLTSGIYMRRFNEETPDYIKKMSLASLIGPIVGIAGAFLFLVDCPNPQINGINYNLSSSNYNGSSTSTLQLSPSTCSNQTCLNCDLNNFIPVCDSTQNLTYFSSCLAGCSDETQIDAGDCSCTVNKLVPGYCDICPIVKMVFFLIGLLLITAGIYANLVFAMNISIRSIDPIYNAHALSIQSFLARILGSIPGPILFGSILDQACVIWNKDDCNDTGSCLLFDNFKTRNQFLIMTLITRFLSLFFVSLCCWYSSDYDNKNNTNRLAISKKSPNSIGKKNKTMVKEDLVMGFDNAVFK